MPCYWYWSNQTIQPQKAVKIQTWWRRMLEVRAAKKPLRRIFEGDVTGLTGLRCLVLIGAHDDVLGTWARATVQRGPEAIFAQALGEDSISWLVLMRKAALLLVLSLTYTPESPNASLYLEILKMLFSNEHAVATSGAQGSAFCQAITAYVMKKKFYSLLRKWILKLPTERSANLPSPLTLCTLPLSTYPENSPQFNEIYIDIFTNILSLPSLPHWVSPDSPSPFISYILLSNLDKLTPRIKSISHHISPLASPGLAANVFMFVFPHYNRLSTEGFASYLQLSVMLIKKFNKYSWSTSSASDSCNEAESQPEPVEYDSDYSDGHTDYEDSQLDEDDWSSTMEITDETIQRLEEVATSQHITRLFNFTQSQPILLPHLAAYLFTVAATWPFFRQEMYHIVLTTPGGRLVGDLYRELVRPSPLGQEENSVNVYESANAMHWPPIILLAEIYSQALYTMDDEEFFGRTPWSLGRNPLTLEEVASFSVQLLNIVFTLYWRYAEHLNEPEEIQYVHVSSEKALREKLMRCLLRIYARDSRQPSVALGHWLLRSQLDMSSFIDAAVMSNQPSPLTYSRLQGEVGNIPWHSMWQRLYILKMIPFAIPFEVRVSIFKHCVVNKRVLDFPTERLNAFGHDQRSRVKIRRGAVAQDGFARLRGVDLKAPLEIVMTDQFGQEEEEIDGGGHFKEFFTSFCQQVLGTHSGLWLKHRWGALYPTTHVYATEDHNLDRYELVGRIVGKAMYEGILVGITFAHFFLSKWLGRRCYFDDLFALDPDLYGRLLTLKHSTENIEDLSLYFTIATEDSGVNKIVDLIPDGRNIAVTMENRLRYIDLAARYRLNAQIKRQSEAFVEGLSQIIPLKWLKMFNQYELQMLIGGRFAPIDLDDLRHHTTYGGIYHNKHKTIIAFWQVVNSFHEWQKHDLLRFVTSCSRAPVLGFKELVPNFTIRDDGSDENRMPTSRTCINLLKLPAYKTERQLRELLLEAISSRAGFDSS